MIIGAGDGLSASLARNLARDYALTLAARSTTKVVAVAKATGAQAVQLDATDEDAVSAMMEALPKAPRVVIYEYLLEPLGDISPTEAE
ncbi:MAG: hypothetical protein HRT60_08260 [Dinoroseobacter sp.]|nr:hypothetical protein [Dinoroseobacter sp.]